MNRESTQESEARFWRIADKVAIGMIALATMLAGYVYFSLR
jgi:hypothetical protein